MNKDQDISDWLKKSPKPEIPEGFFENFQANLMDKIEAQDDDTEGLEFLKKSAKPAIPEGFFEGITEKVLEENNTNEDEQVIKISTWRWIGAVASIAAILTILFYVIPNGNENEEFAETDEIIEESPEEKRTLNDDEIDTYLTYLDEDEIIDYIIEHEIEVDVNASEEIEESEEDEYYLDYLDDDFDAYFESDI